MIREFTHPTIISVSDQKTADGFFIDKDSSTATFIIGPFVRGYAQTIGHSLRRALLSSIPSCGIIYVTIDGVNHKFCASNHIKEDIIHFIENLKKMRFRLTNDAMTSVMVVVDMSELLQRMQVPSNASCFEIRSSMIKTNDFVQITNDEYLCTVNLSKVNNMPHSNFNFSFLVEKGSGYVDGTVTTSIPYGAIPINVSLNAVKRVSMEIVQTRHGEFTDYENLHFTISTDKSIKPIDALLEARSIIMSHFDTIGYSIGSKDVDKKNPKDSQKDLLNKPLRDLNVIKEATLATLEAHRIHTVGQLIQRSAEELMRIPSIGVTKLDLIQEALASHGLYLAGSNYNK